MKSNKLKRKRHRFLENFWSMAKSINYQLFEDSCHIEVFFSGRDEDLISMSFKSNNILFELSIELINHHYSLMGGECVYYNFFNINNGQLVETLKGNFFLSESDTKVVEPQVNLILEKVKQELLKAFF